MIGGAVTSLFFLDAILRYSFLNLIRLIYLLLLAEPDIFPKALAGAYVLNGENRLEFAAERQNRQGASKQSECTLKILSRRRIFYGVPLKKIRTAPC